MMRADERDQQDAAVLAPDDGADVPARPATAPKPIAAALDYAGEGLTRDFMRGRGREQLDATDVAALEAMCAEERVVPPHEIILPMGRRVQHSTFLVDGLMCRYMDDRRSRRQLLSLQVPGDFVDLHAFPLPYLDHDLATLTTCRVAIVPHDRLATIQRDMPRLARMLWFSTLLDAAMHREWIFRLGRLDSVGRVAHLLAEIEQRLAFIGRSDGRAFDLALRQSDLAEICGMTPVHVNRVIRRLRETGIAEVGQGRVQVMDRERLWQLAEFDPLYLFASGPDGAPARPGERPGEPLGERPVG